MDNLAERVATEDEENGLSAKKMIKDEFYDTYENQLKAIWWQLVRLNSNIFILGKIFALPFDEFFQPQERNFWNLTTAALMESSVLIVWRVGIDARKDTLSINGLKNDMTRNNTGYLKEQYKLQCKQYWKANSKGVSLKHIKQEIEELRHKHFAHLNRDLNIFLSKEGKLVILPEFENLMLIRDDLNSRFDALSVGTHYWKLFGSYNSRDYPSDIEKVLEAILRVNPIMNMPEEQSPYWTVFKNSLSPRVIAIMNEYRAKWGLPTV